MNKTNVLSAILVLIFMISCLTFFSASATDGDGAENPSENSSQQVVETTTEPTTAPVESTTAATTTTTTTTVATTPATAADPVYTSSTAKTSATTDGQAGVLITDAPITKETKEIETTEEITEPTTGAKNIVDYGSKYRPIKWLSLVVMIACITALIIINVRYKNKYGKTNSKRVTGRNNAKAKSRLDTSARFTPPVKPQEKSESVESEQVDLSSFSKKANDDDFKPKLVDDDFFGEKKRDDDLYI